MTLTVDIELALPYNPKHATLKGTVEFPLYVPKEKSAASFLYRIARQSRGNYFDNMNL